MNEWSLRRKRIILAIVAFALVVLVGGPLFLLFYKAPTCFDGIQNGNETGVDCGGSCQLLCKAESLPLISRGDPRIFEVSPGVYELAAVVENPNLTAEVYRAHYTFKLFEASSTIPILIVEGETFVPKNDTFVVFEGPIQMSDRRPARAILEWQKDSLSWRRDIKNQTGLSTKNISLTKEDVKPRITANLINNSLDSVSNVELTVLVSGGKDGNLIAASKTFVENLRGETSVPIVFTWSEPFNIKEYAYTCGSPVDIALVLDRSGSMMYLGKNPPQPLTDVKKTALDFTNKVGKGEHWSLISFATHVSQPVDAPLGTSIEVVQKAINDISIGLNGIQNTNIGDGILAGREELNSSKGRTGAFKALVLLTDGVPTVPLKPGVKNYPSIHAKESAELARRDNISIFTIGLGKDVDANLLRSIATSTTEAYFAPTTAELENIYDQITTKICKKSPAVVDIYIKVLPDRSFLR